ncbi:hypothetical protein CENSYa_1584 [Cenarchaeum symbiosum A]|uniref:HTH arsR-type domain-containing protein n=1 Tax=Cenarchaeum symbiosum (strain A) TaxID=414004 RepID=A0RXY7_CENSY|nr:hypothetical protein CENSYa_1584 [Cenarchaeum symbiosum A]
MDPADTEKAFEQLFDPDVAPILAELEDGPRDEAHLSKELDLEPAEIKNRLEFLIQHGFVTETKDPVAYSVDKEKIAGIVEDDKNFQSAIDGLTKMDSYLN